MKMNKLAVLTAVVLLTSTEAKEKCGATKKKKCLKDEGCTWSKSDGCVVCDDCVDRAPKGDWVTNDEHQQFQETVYTHLGDFYANLHCGCSAVSLEDPEHRPNCSRITDRENCSLLIQNGKQICRWIDEDENECLVSKFQDLSSRMEYLAEQSSQLKQESRDKDIIIAELREKVDQSLTTGLQNQDDISGHAAEAEADRNAIKIAHDALAATVADNKVSNNEKFAAAEEQRNAIRQEAAQALTDGLAEADEAMTSAFAETEADRNDKHDMVMERIDGVEGSANNYDGVLRNFDARYVSKAEAQAAKTEATKQVEEQVSALQGRIDDVDGSCEKRRDADDFYQIVDNNFTQLRTDFDQVLGGYATKSQADMDYAPKSQVESLRKELGDYAPLSHNHDSRYATRSHTHNYASSSHTHDGRYIKDMKLLTALNDSPQCSSVGYSTWTGTGDLQASTIAMNNSKNRKYRFCYDK